MARRKHKVYGLTFDSKLEGEHYKMLLEHKDVRILERQKTFVILEPFDYYRFPDLKKSKHRKIQYTPDFIVEIKGYDKPVAIESKGYARKDYMLRKKLFMYNYGDKYYFYQCNSKKQMKEMLEGLNAQE